MTTKFSRLHGFYHISLGMVLRSAGLRPGKELRYERLRVAYIDPRVYFDLEIDIACVFYALVFFMH